MEHIIDKIILKIDVSEFDKYFGNYIEDNILVWSRVLRGLDINTFKKENWQDKHSPKILEEIRKFLIKAHEFFTLYPPENFNQLSEILHEYPKLQNYDEIDILIVCGIRAIQMTKIPKENVNFNWHKYMVIRDHLPL